MSLGVVRNSVKPHKPGASNDFSAYVSFLASSRLSPMTGTERRSSAQWYWVFWMVCIESISGH